MPMSMIMIVFMSAVMVVMPMLLRVFVCVCADFHVATAETTAAFYAHKISFVPVPRRRFPVPARAAVRRWDFGSWGTR